MTTKTKKKLQRLYVDYTTNSTGGDALDPSDQWSDREDEHIEVDFKGVYRSMDTKNAPFFYDSKEVSDEVYKTQEVVLVVVRYNSGDTFGASFGNWYLAGIYLPDEAENIANLIEENQYDGYKPWEGYFETFVGVELHKFNVKDSWVIQE